MNVFVNAEQLDRTIEALQKDNKSAKDGYLISYLKTIRKNCPGIAEVDLDEIPF